MSGDRATLRADSDSTTGYRTSCLETGHGRPLHSLEQPAGPPSVPDRQPRPNLNRGSSKTDSQPASLAGLERHKPATTVTLAKHHNGTADNGPTAVREQSQEMEAV